jgi:hypothetical protein
MDRRNNDPGYQLNEPRPPAGEPGERLGSREHQERALEFENSPAAIQQRQNMNQEAPSEVQQRHEKG